MTIRSYPLKMTRGIVYVLLFELEGKTLIKIGVTTQKVVKIKKQYLYVHTLFQSTLIHFSI
jgi:hypothetical protein